MIRHPHGGEFFLFTQDDHARLSGQLAARVGNSRFAQPLPFAAVVDAVSMHDAGWPLHDSQPTLNADHLPLHVFETPPTVSTRVWMESVRLARGKGPYTGLLVSLHVLALSALAHQHYCDPQVRQRNAAQVFELNKFQQAQIETQETIRRELGMRTDLPLPLGLAPLGTNADEDLLNFNYQILKAMDQISLALLCAGKPLTTIENAYPRPGAVPVDLRLGYVSPWMVSVNPWPFADQQIELEAPYRAVPARAYASEAEFRDVYAAADQQRMTVRVVRET
ncbi:MAG TPA: DUF3891 family protein [Tepidisphaeraceae bacterium]|nr:DUF3891 family protein [Tepidisphaeraceae bacterium]